MAAVDGFSVPKFVPKILEQCGNSEMEEKVNTPLLKIEGDLALWWQNCDVGLTLKTPAEAERVFSILKSSLELGVGIVIRGNLDDTPTEPDRRGERGEVNGKTSIRS